MWEGKRGQKATSADYRVNIKLFIQSAAQHKTALLVALEVNCIDSFMDDVASLIDMVCFFL